MKKLKIYFTGGGTGGHAIPIVAVAREIEKLWEGEVVFKYLGPRDPWAEIFFPEEGIKIVGILSGKIRRYFSPKSIILNFFDLLKIPIGILQSFIYLFFSRPHLIFSKGGFGSFPVTFAAWLLFIPVFLHESDAVPGLANRISSRFARKIFVSFEKTLYFPEKKMIYVGNPIRMDLLNVNKEEAKRYFKITGEKPVLLILGGSQGAQKINEKILEIINDLLKTFEVIHQSGYKNFKTIKTTTRFLIKEELKRYYHLSPFLKEKELKAAYSLADLIVARAGAGVIFEIAAFGKPSILIPLPKSAQDHQTRNAYLYAQSKAAILLSQENITSRFFLGVLRNLISDKESLNKMSQAALKFARPMAAREIAEKIILFLTKKKI
jgi:UDP-N-acetylglucosamine--N-acetylmuramyl-(pentapeptide) pyrophosphoryl-undecaprenol N-acetylglucosamine transferase